jgi:diguanylate cyclase (GGDEF)-like protein
MASRSSFSRSLGLALAVSAGFLAVVAVAAGGSGSTGLAALSSVGAMVAAAAGYSAWHAARRLEASLETIAQALSELVTEHGDVPNPGGDKDDVEPAPETVGLVEALRRLGQYHRRLRLEHQRLTVSARNQELSRRTFRDAVAELGAVARLRDRPGSVDEEAPGRDRDKILEVVAQAARRAVSARDAVFFEFQPGPDRLVARSGMGQAGVVLPARAGLAGAAAVRRAPVRHPDDASPAPPEPDCTSALAVPFFSRGELLGVVAVYGREGDQPFTADDLLALDTLVAQAGTAVDNISLHEETQRLSITDGLTGLWNRRQLELRCQEELERGIRFGRPLGIVFCDVDRFKEINDSPQWLHPGGDAVLVEVARRLASATREIDVVARYGGEEFVLLLPETDLAGTMVLAEKVRRAVGDTPIEYAGLSRTVTVSLGVAAYPHSGGNVRSLLKAAAAALHRAKRSGRNRIEQAEPSIRGTGTGG